MKAIKKTYIIFILIVSTNVFAVEKNEADKYAEAGKNMFDKGSYEEAINLFTKAIELDENPVYYSNRGKAKKFVGDINGAMQDYKNAIELNSDLYEAWYNLGWVKYNKGDLKEAELFFTRAIEINPDYACAYHIRSMVKEETGDLQGAESDMKKYKQFINPVY